MQKSNETHMDFQKNAEDLKRWAINNGRSLRTDLESILEAPARLSNKAEVRALVERIRNRIAAGPQTDSGALQAEDRQRCTKRPYWGD